LSRVLHAILNAFCMMALLFGVTIISLLYIILFEVR